MTETHQSDVPKATESEGSFEFPARVKLFGVAIAPVAKGLRSALARRVKASTQVFVLDADLALHMGMIHQALVHLQQWMESLKTFVSNAEDAGLEDAGREAGRLEQVISEFVDGYLAIKATRSESDTAEAHRLVLGVYRHHLREICEWLEELVLVITNPSAAIAARKHVVAEGLSLSVDLEMSTPREMAKLFELIQPPPTLPEISASKSSDPPPAVNKGPGVLGTIGALVFGFAASDALLKRSRF